MNIVKILESSIKDLRLITKILRFGKSDSHTAFVSQPAGIDSRPIKGQRAVFAETANDQEPVLIGYINENAKADEGEIRLYSIDSDGNEKNYFYILKDGTIEVGGDSDFMVRYSALSTAFDELKTDFNSHITNWNTFSTAYVPGGPSVQGLPPTASGSTPSAADISGAKIEEVKTS